MENSIINNFNNKIDNLMVNNLNSKIDSLIKLMSPLKSSLLDSS
jgi:hypothetical protein